MAAGAASVVAGAASVAAGAASVAAAGAASVFAGEASVAAPSAGTACSVTGAANAGSAGLSQPFNMLKPIKPAPIASTQGKYLPIPPPALAAFVPRAKPVISAADAAGSAAP